MKQSQRQRSLHRHWASETEEEADDIASLLAGFILRALHAASKGMNRKGESRRKTVPERRLP